MNQMFYVEELVQRVALSADGGSPGSASLLALACCCKTLEAPIMDILWQRQKFLHIILRTLPTDCWIVTDKVFVSGSQVNPSINPFSVFPALNQNTHHGRMGAVQGVHGTRG